MSSYVRRFIWTADPETTAVFVIAGSIARRFQQLRRAREEGLTTVEVAVITAVLVGLATALLAVITVAVRRRQAQIR